MRDGNDESTLNSINIDGCALHVLHPHPAKFSSVHFSSVQPWRARSPQRPCPCSCPAAHLRLVIDLIHQKYQIKAWKRMTSHHQGSPFRFSTESRQLPETKFRPKFRRNSLIPNGKGIQIQKTKFRWISTEISVISTGKWCQLWFSYCSRGQMKNFWIPTLFSFSRSTTFVSGTFSFEQWFESYLIISKTTN